MTDGGNDSGASAPSRGETGTAAQPEERPRPDHPRAPSTAERWSGGSGDAGEYDPVFARLVMRVLTGVLGFIAVIGAWIIWRLWSLAGGPGYSAGDPTLIGGGLPLRVVVSYTMTLSAAGVGGVLAAGGLALCAIEVRGQLRTREHPGAAGRAPSPRFRLPRGGFAVLLTGVLLMAFSVVAVIVQQPDSTIRLL